MDKHIRRVLLVDDDEDEYILTRELLTDIADVRFDLTWVATYQAALEVMDREPIDIVLVDYLLGERNGLDLVREGIARGYRAPMILLTGRGSYEVDLEAMKAGAADYLVKGQLNAGLLERAIRYAIERKHHEEIIRDSARRLEAAMDELRRTQQQVIQQERLRALGQMAGGIAHDFNNALSMIMGFTELLLTDPEYLAQPAKARESLEAIYAAGQDAASVVNRLRQFYRPAEEAEQAFTAVDLNEIATQAIALTKPRWKDQAQARGLTIDARSDLVDVPPVLGDGPELREALANLIFNAVDAMPSGGTITVRTRADGDTVRLDVSDTGTGMTEDVRQRCLEPFFTTKGVRGTGLGLAVVHGIVQQHRGTMTIASAPGAGTTITICLPRARSLDASSSARPESASAVALRVLVVDDEPGLRTILRAYLTSEGHLVETAGDGREAFEKFCADEFDLVITDRAMPDLGGEQLSAAIKRRRPLTPIIMLTGFGELLRASELQPDGVDLLLSKPIRLRDLRQAIGELVGKRT